MIYENLQDKVVLARKGQDAVQLGLLQYVLGEVGRQRTVDTSDPAVSKVLKMVRKRLLDSYAQTRDQVTKAELVLLDAYIDELLPKQMSEDDLVTAIDVAIATGAGNIGQVMGQLKQSGTPFDGATASKLIKERLAGN